MGYKMTIPASDVEKVRHWYLNRGGITLWHNQEIGNPRPDVITPTLSINGQPDTKPHWAYGQPESLHWSEIQVTTRVPLLAPKSMCKQCEQCNGIGKRSLHDIAQVRHESVDRILSNTTLYISGVDNDWLVCDCTYCGGTGYSDRRILTGRIKAMYYGPILTSETKARKACAILTKQTGRPVEFDWSFSGYSRGICDLHFYHETLTPFTLG